MEDCILQLEKQCRTLAGQVEDTKKKLDTVINQWKQEVGELLLKLQKIDQSASSMKDWTTQKVIFVLESLHLLGNGIHMVLLDLVMKMTNLPEEIGALAVVESNESKVELLECAKPQWQELIQVLEARLPLTQEVQRGESPSAMLPSSHHNEHVPPRLPGASHGTEVQRGESPAVMLPPSHCDEHAPPRSPGTSHVIDVVPTVPQPTLEPPSDAPLPPQSPIVADQQQVVTTAGDGVVPAAPTSPSSLLGPMVPSTEAVKVAPTGSDLPILVAGPASSPLTALASHPASPINEDQNMSTGCKRKANEEVNVDIPRKKPASTWKKGPPPAPQRKQPSHGRSKAPEGDPVTPGQSSKQDTIMEEPEDIS